MMMPFRLSLLLAALAPAHAAPVVERSLASPDKTLVFTLERDASTQALHFSVTDSNRPVITRGALGLDLLGVGVIGDEGSIGDMAAETRETGWEDSFGERSKVPDRYRQETLTITHAGQGKLGVKLQVRAYDEGVALRYLIDGDGTVMEDKTSFPLPAATQVWTSPTTQSGISKQPISKVSGAGELPVLAELATGGGGWLGPAGERRSRRSP